MVLSWHCVRKTNFMIDNAEENKTKIGIRVRLQTSRKPVGRLGRLPLSHLIWLNSMLILKCSFRTSMSKHRFISTLEDSLLFHCLWAALAQSFWLGCAFHDACNSLHPVRLLFDIPYFISCKGTVRPVLSTRGFESLDRCYFGLLNEEN